MNLSKEQFDVIFRFVDTSYVLKMYDKNNNCILTLRLGKKEVLIDKTTITVLDGKGSEFWFDYSSVEVDSINVVRFYNTNGLYISVENNFLDALLTNDLMRLFNL